MQENCTYWGQESFTMFVNRYSHGEYNIFADNNMSKIQIKLIFFFSIVIDIQLLFLWYILFNYDFNWRNEIISAFKAEI